MISIVVVILALLSAVTSFGVVSVDCALCKGSLASFLCGPSCWFECALRHDKSRVSQDLLRANLFGQEEAKSTILAALERHEASKGLNGPLSMHFAGDNGVGKTLTAKLLAQARFRHENAMGERDGFLYLRGESFRGSNATHVALFRTQLRRQIVETLRKCPHALVVVDEVEKVHRNTISVLQDFLDGTYPVLRYDGVSVRTDHAIFILISDFGVADHTAGMSLDQVRDEIEATSREIWKQRKVADVIDVIVPFRPLDAVALRAIAEHRLSRFSTMPALREARITRVYMSEAALIALVRHVAYNLSGYNGRGVDRVLNNQVLDVVLTAIEVLQRRRKEATDAARGWRTVTDEPNGRSEAEDEAALLDAPHRIELHLTMQGVETGAFDIYAAAAREIEDDGVDRLEL